MKPVTGSITAKNPYSENSLRRNFRAAKTPYGKKYYGEKSNGENSYGENSGHVGENRACGTNGE